MDLQTLKMLLSLQGNEKVSRICPSKYLSWDDIRQFEVTRIVDDSTLESDNCILVELDDGFVHCIDVTTGIVVY